MSVKNDEKTRAINAAFEGIKVFASSNDVDDLRPFFDQKKFPDAKKNAVHLINFDEFTLAFMRKLGRTYWPSVAKISDAIREIDSIAYKNFKGFPKSFTFPKDYKGPKE